MITIKDGVGIINGEPVSTDVDYDNLQIEVGHFRTRRFRIDCHNGYSLSVVFGFGTYSDNRNVGLYPNASWRDEVKCAEIALLTPDNGISDAFESDWGDTVKGYCSAEEILLWFQRACALPPLAQIASAATPPVAEDAEQGRVPGTSLPGPAPATSRNDDERSNA